MFTGLIVEVGYLKKKTHKGNLLTLTIKAERIIKDLQIGGSICVDGICLTVTDFSSNYFVAEVMKETEEKTNLKLIKVNDPLNLELPLKPTSFLGGHIISGHVDSVGRVRDIQRHRNVFNLEIKADSSVLDYLVPKGSIAVNGVSLTIGKLESNNFWVYLIPETIKKTNLAKIKKGQIVNLEADIIGKYIHKFVSKQETKIDESFLVDTGFIKGVLS